jgi:tRNA (guanine-N7-)-methyltransferase
MPPTNNRQDHRPTAVRSFVRRAGRMTAAQKRALTELWPRYGIDFAPELVDFEQVFGRSAPRVMEIGFGNGELLVEMAAAHPERDFLGVEVHAPGVGHCLLAAERASITNLRVICHDAVEVLHEQIADASLDTVQLFFPDPWPKKRHHKRRIVQPAFVRLVARKLKADGVLHMATDWELYAEHIETMIEHSGVFSRLSEPTRSRSKTKFETRGEHLGHSIWERVYRRH